MDAKRFNTTATTDAQALHLLLPNRRLAYADPEQTQPVRIMLKGGDSREFKAEQARQVAALQAKNRQFNGKYDPPLEELETNNRKLYASVVVGFENLENDGVPMQPSDAVEFFKTAPDVFEQVRAFVDDRANFQSGASIA